MAMQRVFRVVGTVHSTLGFDEWVAEFDEWWVGASNEHYARIIGMNIAESHFRQRNRVNGKVPDISEIRVTRIIDLGTYDYEPKEATDDPDLASL